MLRSAAHRRAESRFWGVFIFAVHRAFVLTFRFGAAATAAAAAAAATTASSPRQPPPPPRRRRLLRRRCPRLRCGYRSRLPRLALASCKLAKPACPDAGHHPNSLGRWHWSAEVHPPLPLRRRGRHSAARERRGHPAARSRATCRRANHLLAAASTADAAPAVKGRPRRANTRHR